MRRAIFTTLVLGLGMTATAAAATVFPQLALGGGYECVLIVSNKTDTEWVGTVYAYQHNREPWSVGWRYNGVLFGGQTEIDVSVPAKATRKIQIFGDQSLQSGYLKLSAASGSSDTGVAISFFYNYLDAQGHLLDSTGIGARLTDKEYMLPVERSSTVNTGIAWAPLLVSDYTIELTLFDSDGNVFGTRTITGSGHAAQFFDEIFEGVPPEFVGMMYINSDGWLYATGLRLEYTQNGFQLTSVPPDDLVP